MHFTIQGHLLQRDTHKGVHGATIQLAKAHSKKGTPAWQIITNREGQFQFNIKHFKVGPKQQAVVKVALRVVDRKGQPLGKPTLLSICPGDQLQQDIFLDPKTLGNANLPRFSNSGKLLQEDTFETIQLAIEAAAPEEQNRYMAMMTTISNNLSPICDSPDLLDIADGVLRGIPEDIRQFQSRLNQFATWNQRHTSNPAVDLSAEEAEQVLDVNFLRGIANQSRPTLPTDTNFIFDQRSTLTLLMAAMHSAGDDLVLMSRNIGTLFDQFCGLSLLGRLNHAAQNAFSGLAIDQRAFLESLRVFGGFGGGKGPDDGPVFPPIPRPGGGGSPTPFPCPGGLHWPPSPGGSGRPLLPPGFRDDCPVEEAIAGFRELMRRRIHYTITSISPARACPGEVITIRGTNLVFEGRSGNVLFPGPTRGTQIPGIVQSWAETEIEVIVPPGAVCGELMLDLPVGDTLLVCSTEFELFLGSTSSVPFLGGDSVITRFYRSSSPPGGCFCAGDLLNFVWDTCNIDRIELQIQEEGGRLLASYNFTPDRNRFSYRIPVLSSDSRVTATLQVFGPCGSDSRTLNFAVKRDTALLPEERFPFTIGNFTNWHGNMTRRSIAIAAPNNMEELIRAVKTAELLRLRIGVMGSRCSFTDCVVPPATTNGLINTGNLNKRLDIAPDDLPVCYSTYSPAQRVLVLAEALRASISSVIDREERDAYAAVADGDDGMLPVRQRLVHVEAGLKVRELNCLLDASSPALALPTMGGGTHQSIVGAFSTGTHGGTSRLRPISDFVRAIHLIGPGGQEWWLEPRSRPITDPERMEALKLRSDSGLSPCIRVVYDDDLFYATLVSFGSAGIIYSVVLEATIAHKMRSDTVGMRWPEAQQYLEDAVIRPTVPNDWFVELTLNPTRQCRLTTKNLTTEADREPGGNIVVREELLVALFGPAILAAGPAGIIGLGTGAIGFVLGIVPAYIARRTAEIGSLFARLPFTPPWEWDDVYREILALEEEIEVVTELVDAIRDFVRIINSDFNDETIADALPNLLNLLWHIGIYVIEGRDVIDQIQNIYTNRDQRPEGTWVGKSFRILTGQGACPVPTPGMVPPCPPVPEDPTNSPGIPYHSPFVRLIASHEYAIPANRCIEFVNALLAIADDIRATRDALIVIINLRFTKATRSLIGMQQFERSCHIEVFTPRDLNGNDEFFRRMRDLADRMDATPHWGQLHRTRMDYPGLFGRKLERWQRAMDRIANESEGNPNTFRHDFARQRGLLVDL